MTPTRVRRSSKAPNRFSSDNSRIETSNANGETIIDYNDNSTSTTHTLAPISRTIKLKPVLREPLKVKLPKLKRPHLQSTKDHTANSNTPVIKIHKIKLPSLSAKKSKNIVGDQINSKSSPASSGGGAHRQHQQAAATPTREQQQHNKTNATTYPHASTAPTDSPVSKPVVFANHTTASPIDNSCSKSLQQTSSKLDISTTSKSSDGGDQSSANTSMSSDEGDGAESRMEIVVNPTESSNGSGIRCPCGVDDDLGVMVECESCSTWQHGHCINVGTEEEAYEGYICAFCALPQDRARESLYQLTVGDRFQARFKLLESLRRQNDTSRDLEKPYSPHEATENSAQLTVEELTQAIKDLHRVLNSLRVKWRLFTSQAYELELRIWQNPVWSDEQTSNPNKDKNFYFLDRCRGNLELNIRNMVRRMKERCCTIDYAISLAAARGNTYAGDAAISQESKIKTARKSLEEVTQGVKEFKNKLKLLSS